ncbi:lycopene cyclase family protein [Streptomyces sp. RKAG290]|uniref:lycopene cyclase family protein n=1 Tax=Streptomyces sp. RKAG290 TaxID=2888348 RepID=UPI0020348B21|nr:lycopene cyclase family protein [Streptomyces sp. RKAG290]MCM2416165.1 lycopene cyclase [Streptomyces sp. RKAG290]
MPQPDVVIVGAGAAGLTLAHELCAPTDGIPVSVVLVEAPPGPSSPPPRTWCFWEPAGGAYDDVLSASWERLRVTGPDGVETVMRPDPFCYKMLRSDVFESLVQRRLSRAPGFRRVEATVTGVGDAPGGGGRVVARDARGERALLHGRYVFDSRPPSRLPAARTTLLQHFTGWFVETDRPVFDPATADLMDFRTPQPPHGLSFGYVLPLGPRKALVEYTEFSRTVLKAEGYERALRHYTGAVWGIGAHRVTAVERGVIPMTDGRFPVRAGRSVFRIGTAGGATRPSTGYTFAAVQRQSRAIAAQVRGGGRLRVAPAYGAWQRVMDAVMLRALDSGRVDGAEFFSGLFRTVPGERLLRFLDGTSRRYEDVLVGLCTPTFPMLRTVAELPFRPRRQAPAGELPPRLHTSPPPTAPDQETSDS